MSEKKPTLWQRILCILTGGHEWKGVAQVHAPNDYTRWAFFEKCKRCKHLRVIAV